MADKIYILIAVSGESPKLTDTLKSLAACKMPVSFSGLIIIENGRKNNIEQKIEDFKDVLNITYLYQSTANKSAALNYALQYITDDVLIVFADDDVIFDDNFLNVYDSIKHLDKFFFGGRVNPIYETKPPDWLSDFLPDSAVTWPRSHNEPVRFLGANWAVRSSYIKKAGNFDNRFGPGTFPRRTGQERKMQDDLVKMGIRPYFLPKAIIYHYVPASKSSIEFAMERMKQTGISTGIRLREEKMGILLFTGKQIHRILKIIAYQVLCLIMNNKRNKLKLQRELNIFLGTSTGYFIR